MATICAGTGKAGVYSIGYSDNGYPDYLGKIGNDKGFYNPHHVQVNLLQLSPYTPFPVGESYRMIGTLIGTTGTATGSNTRDKVFDDNLSTYFDAPTASDAWVGYDLGAGNQKVVSVVRFAPRSNNAGRMVGGQFQGANRADFSDAVTLYPISLQPLDGFFTTVNLQNNTAYRYLRYLGPPGGFCNVAEIRFYGAPLPGIPGAVTATPGDQQATVSWGAVVGATSYNVKRATNPNGPFFNLAQNVTNASCLDAHLANAITYYYVVSALTLAVESSNSTLASVIPLGPPAAPQNVLALAGTNHAVTLSWSTDPNSAGFVVQRAPVSGGPYVPVAVSGSGACTNTGLNNGVIYYYVIQATNSAGVSSNSVEVFARPGDYGSWVRASGPAAYWPLDETSGLIAGDVMGANDGTHSANVGLGAAGAGGDGFGPAHRAAQYNGTDAYSQIPNLLGATNFTITLWVKTTNNATGANWYNGLGLVDGEMAGPANDFGTTVLSNRFAFGVGNADITLLSAQVINDGGWHFLAATRNSGSGALTVYVDGAPDGTRAGPAGARTAATNLRIGSLQTGVAGRFLNGAISDVAVFNQAMSPPQVNQLYRAGAGIFYDLALTYAMSGTNGSLTWPGGGQLMSATNVAGPWTLVNSAASPFSVPPGEKQKFFRVQVE